MTLPLQRMPATFAAGTTVDWTRSYPDYPAVAGWSLRIYLAGPSASINELATPDNAGNWAFTLPSTTTGAMIPGTYRWTERAENAGRFITLDSDVVMVTLDLAQAAAGDAQTWEEKTLAAVEDLLANRAVDGIESYQIAGRSIAKMPIQDLIKLRGQLAAAVNRQRGGGQLGRQHLMNFKRATF